MGHVSIKTNHLKYESYVINSPQDNEQTPCVHLTLVTLTFNLVNPKTKRVQAFPRPISM